MCVQYMYSIMFIRAAFCFSPVSCSHCHCRTSTCRTTASLHFTCFVLFLLSQLQGPGAPRLRLYMYLLVAQSGLTLSMSVRIRSLHSTFFLACCATYRKKKTYISMPVFHRGSSGAESFSSDDWIWLPGRLAAVSFRGAVVLGQQRECMFRDRDSCHPECLVHMR